MYLLSIYNRKLYHKISRELAEFYKLILKIYDTREFLWMITSYLEVSIIIYRNKTYVFYLTKKMTCNRQKTLIFFEENKRLGSWVRKAATEPCLRMARGVKLRAGMPKLL